MTLFPAESAMPTTAQFVVPPAVPEAPVAALVHVTCARPRLSDAVPPSEIGEEAVVYVGEEVGDVMAHVGAVPSYITVSVSVAVFPAASRATTAITLFPETSATEAIVQLVVPVAVPFAPVARFVHTTAVTPTLSDAVPPSESGEEAVVYVGEEVGEVIVQVGAVVSGGV
jgi:hypothetical protein